MKFILQDRVKRVVACASKMIKCKVKRKKTMSSKQKLKIIQLRQKILRAMAYIYL